MILTLYVGILIVLVAVVLILLRDQIQLKQTIFPVYLIFLILTFICYIMHIFGLAISIVEFLGSLWLYTAFGLVIIHSSIKLGNKKTLLFYLLALGFGLVSELIGVKYGWIFGNYYYNPILTPFVMDLVPVSTVISWAVIIYISYTFSNIIIEFGTKKPYLKHNSIIYVLIVIFGLSLISGFVAANLDMLIDPVVVATQGWFWVDGGPYYGIPISNFVGWFIVAFLATFIFRLIESSTDPENSKSMGSLTLNASIIGIYTMFFLIYGFSAILIGHQEYLLIGVMTMGPLILITVILTYLKNVKGVKYDE